MASKDTNPSQKRTIGLLASRIGRTWGAEFLNGVSNTADLKNVNLICFVGGKPVQSIKPGVLTPAYEFYDMVQMGSCDGLLLASDLGHGMLPAEMQLFQNSLPALPTVANALGLENTPNVTADNFNGMQEVVRHLIEEHGYRKIAFIGGPRGHYESEERLRAYKETLKANKIRVDEKLIFTGDFSSESGRAATNKLLDEFKQRPEALVCANDRMAFGALEALEARQIFVPDDIALTGFDDILETQSLGVPLTTVRQSFYQAGKQSLEVLIRLLNGEDAPPETRIATHLVIRSSCGCLPESVRKAVVESTDVAQTGHLENRREATIRALIGTANTSRLTTSTKDLTASFSKVWDSLLDCLNNNKPGISFLRSIEQMVSTLKKRGTEPGIWHDVLSTLRKHALAGIKDPAIALQAENLFQQARLLVGEISQRTQASRKLEVEQQEDVLQNFSFHMASAMSLKEIGTAISKNFPTMGIDRSYIITYGDSLNPQAMASEDFHLLLEYDGQNVNTPIKRPKLPYGYLTPPIKTSQITQHAIVMPLSLANNRFGFLWMQMSTPDWEVYMRARNLIASAMLRNVLAEQREEARREVERLLEEAKQTTVELAISKEFADQTALENAHLYQSEQRNRQNAEGLARASRNLSTLLKMGEVHKQILEELHHILPFSRGALFLEEIGGYTTMLAHLGFPDDERVEDLRVQATKGGVYDQIAQTSEPLVIKDVTTNPGWVQIPWLPLNKSWLGVPLFAKNKVIGMLSLTRPEADAFSNEDVLLATTFCMQAAIALENARLYDEVTRFNEMMERMVSQRVEELNNALSQLEKLDKNKTSFIQVAAHELRTPITVMKGYLTMLRGTPNIQENADLVTAVEGVLNGTDRLHQIVNAMLDVVKLDNQALQPHLETITIAPLLNQINREYKKDLEERTIKLLLDDSISQMPSLQADQQLLRKALDNIVVNAIKFTPDGGLITIGSSLVSDERLGQCIEIRVHDTGIGIDPANHKIIFEKLFQVGKVELHSSGRTKYKGGGPGLGLAIAAGIIRAHRGRVWVESPKQDETEFPGSTFFVRLPLN